MHEHAADVPVGLDLQPVDRQWTHLKRHEHVLDVPVELDLRPADQRGTHLERHEHALDVPVEFDRQSSDRRRTHLERHELALDVPGDLGLQPADRRRTRPQRHEHVLDVPVELGLHPADPFIGHLERHDSGTDVPARRDVQPGDRYTGHPERHAHVRLVPREPGLRQPRGAGELVPERQGPDEDDPGGGRQLNSAGGLAPGQQRLDGDNPGGDRQFEDLAPEQQRLDRDDPGGHRQLDGADDLEPKHRRLDGDDPGSDREPNGADAVELGQQRPDGDDSGDADDESPGRIAWRAVGDLGRAVCREPVLFDLAVALADPARATRRNRELFPFPLVPQCVLDRYSDMTGPRRGDVVDDLYGVVLSLNLLYGVRAGNLEVGLPTVAQATAHGIILEAALELHAWLATATQDRTGEGWKHFEKDPDAERLVLVSEKVAVPDCAATCNPSRLTTGPLGTTIANVDNIFPSPPSGLDIFPGFRGGKHAEYVALTIRQLRAVLLRLSGSYRGGASVSSGGKSGDKQRVVWNGIRVSLASARPPAPEHLADPAAFGMLDLTVGTQLCVTKRDCRTWFDQLEDPAISDFVGRPSVTRGELTGGGLADHDVATFCGTDEADTFTPCSCGWPMGFPWTSCVAKASLSSICDCASLTREPVLACDTLLPRALGTAFAVATDDLMIFQTRGRRSRPRWRSGARRPCCSAAS